MDDWKPKMPLTMPTDYDPEVLRAAQKDADQRKNITDLERTVVGLEKSVAEWKERATVAEKLNKSLDERIAQYREDVDRLTKEQNKWRDKCLIVKERLKLDGKIILESLRILDELDETHQPDLLGDIVRSGNHGSAFDTDNEQQH